MREVEEEEDGGGGGRRVRKRGGEIGSKTRSQQSCTFTTHN